MPIKATPLTDSAIKMAKPKEKPYKLTDGQGLYLEVMANGSKLWRLLGTSRWVIERDDPVGAGFVVN
ncbi:hypothetical protein FQZ97_1192500 [compost metagenome]|jgi:hypothetical protein